MYCSGCGNQLKRGLNYCNSCGAKAQDPNASEVESVSKRLSNALSVIGGVGIGGLLFFLLIISKNHAIDGPILGIVALVLTAVLGISFGILWQISKLNKQNEMSGERVIEPPAQPQLKSPTTNQLEAPTQPPASVVENTTRTLDKVGVERK